MAVDTPAKIAVLGAGPIGLETALYARFLGYEVEVFERAQVAHHVRQWGHVRMFSPLAMNCSALGMSALAAQEPERIRPDKNALLTGNQWVDEYLMPLATTDLLNDSIKTTTEVISIGRESLLKGDSDCQERRAESPFRILIRGSSDQEQIVNADVVIDTTGVFGNPNWLGAGGIPAIGELASSPNIDRRLPDVLGADRQRFVGRNVLLVGSGYSAATSIVALAKLVDSEPSTKVTWVVRESQKASSVGPITEIDGDPLDERARLSRTANELARDAHNGPRLWDATSVHSIYWRKETDDFHVELMGKHAGRYEFDRVIANVGYRPNAGVYGELQVHQCYATEGPMKLAAWLHAHPSKDCLRQASSGVAALCTTEPSFYILGAKSYGRKSNFLFSMGLDQIRQLFTLIGDRSELDLYSSVQNLSP